MKNSFGQIGYLKKKSELRMTSKLASLCSEQQCSYQVLYAVPSLAVPELCAVILPTEPLAVA